MNDYTCKTCGLVVSGTYDLAKHRHEMHPRTPKKPLSPQERILAAEKEIQDALLDIDIEQHTLQERIISLDTLKAKYKNVI